MGVVAENFLTSKRLKNIVLKNIMYICADHCEYESRNCFISPTTLHEIIIKKAGDQKLSVGSMTNTSSGGGSGSSTTGKLCVILKFLLGEAGQLRKDQNNIFKNLIEVRRLGFPNVIMPGDVR